MLTTHFLCVIFTLTKLITMTQLNFLDVNSVFFTVLNYPMSFVEFFGTIFTAWSVYLAAKNKLSTWPIGILGIILYSFLFYQVHLYSDLVEQIYYFITSFWGWWLWTHPKNSEVTENNKELKVGYTKEKFNFLAVVMMILLTVVIGYVMTQIHIWSPTLFPEPASFPYLDAFTTVMSFVATIYLAKRKIESWYIWILVDIIGVWLYYQKGVVFISLLYFAFLINAIKGYFEWIKNYKAYEK